MFDYLILFKKLTFRPCEGGFMRILEANCDIKTRSNIVISPLVSEFACS